MLTVADLQRWLDAYLEAWRTYDPEKIGALFSEDARYAYDPFERFPEQGRAAIVQAWLESRDDPDGWEAEYRPLVVMNEFGIAQGWTKYHPTSTRPAREYRNLFVLRFDDQRRCREFTEWFMERSQSRSEMGTPSL